MTIGERIQQYRKNLGLSQEELGARLHLSRQTVSLWEKGQTFPTIDNLIRLKEIFGVSIDAMVDGETDEVLPLEEYTAVFEENELAPLLKHRRRELAKSFIPSLALWIVSIVILALIRADLVFIGFVAGALFVDTVFSTKQMSEKYKDFKRTVLNIEKSTVRIRVYDKYVSASFIENGETVVGTSGKLEFVSVKKTCGFVELTVGNILCYINIETLTEKSLLGKEIQ